MQSSFFLFFYYFFGWGTPPPPAPCLIFSNSLIYCFIYYLSATVFIPFTNLVLASLPSSLTPPPFPSYHSPTVRIHTNNLSLFTHSPSSHTQTNIHFFTIILISIILITTQHFPSTPNTNFNYFFPIRTREKFYTRMGNRKHLFGFILSIACFNLIANNKANKKLRFSLISR